MAGGQGVPNSIQRQGLLTPQKADGAKRRLHEQAVVAGRLVLTTLPHLWPVSG
jgi:hypothetical protein